MIPVNTVLFLWEGSDFDIDQKRNNHCFYSCFFFIIFRSLMLLGWPVGLIFMAFGPSYAYSLIRLVYGQKWSDGEASTALGYYCFYIIVLAMNGE